MSREPSLGAIREKVEAGARLSREDGLFLDEHADLFTLGELANLVRERKNGNRTYYNVNTHLNPTNVCVYRCTFCAFRADLKSPKGYVMTDEQIVAIIAYLRSWEDTAPSRPDWRTAFEGQGG